MFSAKEMLKCFVDFFDKRPTSNIGKIIHILHDEMSRIYALFEKIEQWKNIDEAKGKTLDHIGENVIQSRGKGTDEVYRVLLKSKIARNFSKTDVNTIVQVLSLALDCGPEEIAIHEKFTDVQHPEPAAISLIQIPIKRLNEVGMNPAQFGRMVQRTVAAGVKVTQIDLTGTFRLATIKDHMEESDRGLSDHSGTTGGTIGMVYIPSLDEELPL